MTFGGYVYAVSLMLRAPNNSNWRIGQTYFNVLVQENPDLADTIRGDFRLDPFYQDQIVPAFLAYVCEHWEEAW